MKIKEMFEKNIFRNINGVIKVEQDDEEHVFQELDEYVITRETDKHIHTFFDAYTKSLNEATDKIGVWISGFFGSGKSHFLKILSYLLSNQTVQDKSAFEFFNEKLNDEMLLADIEKSVTGKDATLDVILFNIDTKSSSQSKQNKDAIVDVLMKVFNESQGYCGEIPWVAETERKLTANGKYDEFKKQYKSVTGNTWEENRDSFYFYRDEVIKVLQKVMDMSAESAAKWFDNAEANYTLNIEKFAKIIKDYCKNKGKNHRVLFLIDEVGQYIGDNTNLMLSLQTVTENLGTQLKGKAWIIVTSQEAIDSITRLKGRDFSKIRGRFATSLSLSSDNTDAVIKKRILKKTDVACMTLQSFYAEKKSIIKNLISFSANTAEMKSYADDKDFIEIYPFLPYQFNLVQKVFEQIRKMGAAGAHLAEGERSMLSAFQEAAQTLSKDELGSIVPFSYFYKSVETFLHAGIRRTISQAYDNDTLEKQDVELLKILFMIKYIKEVRPNIENLTTLSLTHVDENKIKLKERITSSLQRLREQTLIHQNGDEFEFLTDEEQDVNREIKNTDIEPQSIIEYVSTVIFDDIYPDPKYKHSKTNVYGYNRQVDSIKRGPQGHELTMKVMTPYDDDYNAEESTLVLSMGHEDVMVKLPDNDTFLQDIKEYLQIKKYIQRKSSMRNSENIQKIIDSKSRESRIITERIKNELSEQITQATVYIKGEKVDIQQPNAKVFLNACLEKLTENVYTKLNYVTAGTSYIEDVTKILLMNDIESAGLWKDSNNKLALDEIMQYIRMESERHLKITMKHIKTKFTQKPFGWNENDVAGMVARLFVIGEIRLKYNDEYLNTRDKKVSDYLIKRDQIEKLIISLRTQTPPEDINAIKKIIRDCFDIGNLPDDEDGIFHVINEILTNHIKKLTEYKIKYNTSSYPGKEVVYNGIGLLKKLADIKDAGQMFKEIKQKKKELENYAEVIEPVNGFFTGQVDIFDEARKKYVFFQRDESYVDQDTVDMIRQIDEILNMDEPYGRIKDLPELMQKIQVVIDKELAKWRKAVKGRIDKSRQEIEKMLNEDRLSDEFNNQILSGFNNFDRNADTCNDCTELDAMMSRIHGYECKCYNEINAEIQKQGEQGDTPEVKQIQTVNIKQITGCDGIIETNEQLNEFINTAKDKLQRILDKKKRIKLI